MAEKTLIALAALAALLAVAPTAQAEANLEIISPDNGHEYVTTGSLEITIKIKNNGLDYAEEVRVSLDIAGFAYSANSIAKLNPGDVRSILLRVTGLVGEETDARITAYGSGPNGTDGDHINIVFLPPKAELKIESPKGEISLVGIPEKGSAKISVAVRNYGGASLAGVAITFERLSAGLSCTASNPQSIAPGKTASYSITCNNVSSGKSFRITAADADGRAFDTESITLRLVEQMLPNKLDILSPLENAELRVPDAGMVVKVLVRNNGLASLTGVCAFVEGIGYNASGCADLDYNKTHEFDITLVPTQELALAKLIVNDSRGKAEDEIGVRVLRVQAIRQPVNLSGTNDTMANDSNPNGTPTVQNTSGQGTGLQGGNASGPKTGPFGLPQDVFNLLLVIVPLAALGVGIKIAVSRANKN